MKDTFDVIIIGGSYSGLAAGMALGRSLRKVLIIDSGNPCNRQTPHSHNFLTQDGKTPKEISNLAKQQVEQYKTVEFFHGLAIRGTQTANGFEIQTESGETFAAKKLIVATGVKDLMPDIKGFAECWGISVVHCPYCHGYEIRNERTGILANGDMGFEFSKLITNWTKELTLYTNGASKLSVEQTAQLATHHVSVIEKEITRIEHVNGQLSEIVFKDGSRTALKALYAKIPFEQHSSIPQELGCVLTEDGYIQIDAFQKTTVKGVYACGDNAVRMRSVANAVAMGTTAGAMLNMELVGEEF